jgi:hypothetical protein
MKVKKVKFDKYYRNKRLEYVAKLCRLRNSFDKRSVRERPRDELEEKLLLTLDKKRWQKMMASGELVKLGNRHWALKIF